MACFFTIRGLFPVRTQSVKRKEKPVLEHLEDRQLLAADGILPDEPVAIIQGFKWQDDNGNSSFDRGESGLDGVTIYADMNENQRLDDFEPAVVTNDGGLYQLEVPGGGEFTVREVVPEGFAQTYPLTFFPGQGGGVVVEEAHERGEDEFAEVRPSALHLELGPGEELVHPVEVVIHPFCIVPVEIDLVSQSPDIEVRNLSGVQVNGCGGDVSTFEVAFVGAGEPQEVNLVAIDAASGNEFGFVHVTIDSFGGGSEPGGHFVVAAPGDLIEGLDFGNQPVEGPTTTTLEGRKWSDDNGNGRWDEGEATLGGVAIYLDANNNGRLDRGEPSRETLFEDPFTDFDEGGLYSFDVKPGNYTIRELVPHGYRQTYPAPTADVINSESRSVDGGAIEFDLSEIEWKQSDEGESVAVLSYDATWPDGCSRFHGDNVTTVINDHIIVDMTAEADSDACPEIIGQERAAVAVEGLEPGNYTVVTTLHESLPFREEPITATSHVVLSKIAVGTAGAHFVSVTGETTVVSDLNFGNELVGPAASLSGAKWHDRNGNGVREDDEPGLGGVTIYLDVNNNGLLDENEPSTISAEETGEYQFVNVAPGRYTVSEVVPEGYRQTFPWGIAIDPLPGFPAIPFFGQSHFVSVEPGEQLHNLDFGNQKIEPGFVSGTKWHDANGNAERDENEPGLAGVTIYLDLNYNGQLDEDEPSVVTADDGSYTLTAPQPGTVAVREIVPDGYVQTFPQQFIWFEDFGGDGGPWPVEPDWPIGGPIEPNPDAGPWPVEPEWPFGVPVEPNGGLWPIDILPPFPGRPSTLRRRHSRRHGIRC